MRYFFALTMILLCGCNPTRGLQVGGSQAKGEFPSDAATDEKPVLPDEQFDRVSDEGTGEIYSEDLDGEGAVFEKSDRRLADLPDGRYTLISRSRYISDDERLGRQRIVLEKSGEAASGMILVYLGGNPCFEGTVVGDRIVNVQTAELSHTDAGADAPVASEYAIQASEYIVEFGDNDHPEEIEACQSTFFNLTAPSNQLGEAIEQTSALFSTENNGQINMRERPSLGADVVNTASSGSSAYVFRVQEDFLGDIWYYVGIAGGDSGRGWVRGDLIELSSD